MKIIVGIMSCQAADERQSAVRRTWLRTTPDCETMFFVGRPGRPPSLEGDTLYLDCSDWYEDLPAKTLAFLRYCLEHFQFDYIFKCDDDTYVDLQKLVRMPFLGADYVGHRYDDPRWSRSYHVGKCHNPALNVPTTEPKIGPWMMGGPGYWLSRRAAQMVVEFMPGLLASRRYEDKAVADALRMAAHRGRYFVERDAARYLWNGHDEWTVPARHLAASETVSAHPLLPDAMLNVHAALGRANTGEEQHCGILTGADSGFFAGSRLLYRSVREHVEWPFMLFDQGLTAEERKVGTADGMIIRDLPELPSRQRLRDARERQLWIKPFLIGACPFTHVLWIDSDAVVLRNLTEAFVLATKGFTVFRELHWPEGTPNPLPLYLRFPTAARPSGIVLNAGVIFCHPRRDDGICNAWRWLARHAIEDREVAKLIRWHDQGCLIWALHTAGRLSAVSDDTRWNALPNGLVRAHVSRRKRYIDDGHLFDHLRADHPDANILHWMGWPKLHANLLDRPSAQGDGR